MLNRRELLQGAAGAASASLLAGAAALFARESLARPAQALRPPGALPEPQFLGACIRCGLCVRDCPPQNLKLSTGTAPALGTPYFTAREIPCEMCEDLPCVKACPTGALDHGLKDITKARMGVAVLSDTDNCLNFLGLRCDACYRACPLVGQAITLDKVPNPRSDRHALLLPVVHAEACTGCGKCERACVLEKAAIKVLPAELARGEAGQHWRKGWEAPQRAGQPGFDLPVQRLPDDRRDLVPLRSGADPYPNASGAAR